MAVRETNNKSTAENWWLEAKGSRYVYVLGSMEVSN